MGVEVGRVAVIADGANKGKLAAIVDVIDQNRALIEGPGIARGAARLSTLHLTKLKVKVNHSAKSSILKKAWKMEEVDISLRLPVGASASRRPLSRQPDRL